MVARRLAFRLKKLLRRLVGRRQPWQYGTIEARFAAIYQRNWWKDSESVSGPGSSLAETSAVRRQLPALLERIGARSMLDVPCGDFHWMQQVDLGLRRYIGADIVPEIVESNRQRFGSAGREFLKLDVTADRLPTVDLILCRDCLVHFSLADIRRALANILRSGSKYVLTTTFTGDRQYHDIETGQWHHLNLQRPPFELPEPIALLSEENPRAEFADKCLGLWRVADLARGTWQERRVSHAAA
jgi:SAM-dependent methyltransferase